ncbi:MAG: type IV pilus secretin PilQ [Polyangiaceae bacterium]
MSKRVASRLLSVATLPLLLLVSESVWAQGMPAPKQTVLTGANAKLSAQAAAGNHIREVLVREAESEGTTEVEVPGTSEPVYSVRVENGGFRIIVDIANADLSKVPNPLGKTIGLVGGMMTQAFQTAQGSLTRITVNLVRPASYRVRSEGSTLKLSLTAAKETRAESQVAVPRKPTDPTDFSVRDVRFERRKDIGKDRIIVELSQIPAYALTTLPSGRLRLELRKTKLTAAQTRTLDVTSFRGVMKTISAFYDEKSETSIIELDREGEAAGALSVEDGRVVWTFEAPGGDKRPGAATPGAEAAKQKGHTVARDQAAPDGHVATSILELADLRTDVPVQTESTQSGTAGFTSTVAGQAVGTGGRYSGRRIDLDLKDADIHNVLRFLADVGKVNIVTADDVTGTITIRMRNVPWDQALDVVLQAKGLGMVRAGNLIRVAPLDKLQKERELRLAAAKQEFELTPLETRLIPVSYAQADHIQTKAKDLLSPRGSVSVDERTNTLIARDISSNLNFIEELVRSLDTQTPQVLVEARIVEATSRYLRDIGIQWGGDATFAEATGNPTGVAFPSKVSLSGGNYDPQTPTAGLSPFQRQVPQPNFAVNLPAAVGTGQGGALGFSLGSIDNNFNLGVRLSAAEASGMLRIVSSPRILTLDNMEARINQGTLIPFSQVSAQGVQTTFQEAKLQLLVKPHVTADGAVAMHVKINRDEPDFNQTSARGDPTILKREAETDLLVLDGHTAVIGGIYTRNTGRNVDQVPFFGDIPVIGVLFQRRRATDTRNELVIFLTPRIVNRAEAIGR